MPRRRAGVLLPLELAILGELATEADLHGFALAQRLNDHGGRGLLGHGTLYKALDRLSHSSLVESTWETGDASELGRPLRRLYRITGAGRVSLAEQRTPVTVTVGARRAVEA